VTKSEIAKLANQLKPHLEKIIAQTIAARLAQREQTSPNGAGGFMQSLQRALDEKRRKAAQAARQPVASS
jgi:hypothetical protein